MLGYIGRIQVVSECQVILEEYRLYLNVRLH